MWIDDFIAKPHPLEALTQPSSFDNRSSIMLHPKASPISGMSTELSCVYKDCIDAMLREACGKS